MEEREPLITLMKTDDTDRKEKANEGKRRRTAEDPSGNRKKP
jgi:hypothetical protein